MQRRSNTTTFILVAFLLGAVAMVTGIVKGKPGEPPTDEHDHDKEAKTEQVADVKKAPDGPKGNIKTEPTPKASPLTPEQEKKLDEMAKQRDTMKSQSAHQKPSPRLKGEPKPVGNPLSVDITSDYYTNHDDGVAGVSKMDKLVAAKQEEQRKYNDAYKKLHPTPDATKSSTKPETAQ